jgi:hypothetical protein
VCSARRVGKAGDVELVLGVARSQAEFEASVDEQVGGGGFTRDECWVVEVWR